MRTNTGKQTIGYAACIIWDKLPLNLKELNIHQFSKQLKPYLLTEQHNSCFFENSSYLIYFQLQNLENGLENPKIISAPG